MSQTATYHESANEGALPDEFRSKPAGTRYPPRNISQLERVASALAGGALLAAGVAQCTRELPGGRLSGALLGLGGAMLLYRGWSGHCHGYEALGINTAEHNSATAIPARQGVKLETTIAVCREADDLYEFWSNLENLPRVMHHLENVEVLDGQRSRWTARGPFDKRFTWEAEIIEQREPELIAWRSLPGGDVDTAGSVHFRPLGNDRGTAIVLSLKYNPPAGKVGAALASLLGQGFEADLDDDLRRFKSIMEAGEAPTTVGQPRGN